MFWGVYVRVGEAYVVNTSTLKLHKLGNPAITTVDRFNRKVEM